MAKCEVSAHGNYQLQARKQRAQYDKLLCRLQAVEAERDKYKAALEDIDDWKITEENAKTFRANYLGLKEEE